METKVQKYKGLCDGDAGCRSTSYVATCLLSPLLVVRETLHGVYTLQPVVQPVVQRVVQRVVQQAYNGL